jgi:hypothetical protein
MFPRSSVSSEDVNPQQGAEVPLSPGSETEVIELGRQNSFDVLQVASYEGLYCE